MTNFAAFFLLELKRFLRKRNLIILLILFIILTYFLFLGCNEHKANVEKANKFKDLERLLYNKMTTYLQVSIQGIRFLMIPSRMESLFINSNILSDISSRINTTASLQIFNNLKNRNLFKGNQLLVWDFAGMLLLTVSILCLLWGNETLRDKSYLKFLSSFVSHKRAYFYTILSRIILLILAIMFLFAIMFLLLTIKNVTFSSTEINCFAGYILKVILIFLFFFSAGVLISFIRSKAVGIITAFAAWFLFLFIIPGMLNLHTAQKADNIRSDYQSEFDKIKILTDFEKIAKREYGSNFNRNNMELAIKIVEDYFWKLYYPKIDAVDEKIKGEIIENIDRYRKLSVLFPTTFYYATCKSIGSRGFESFIEFYTYLQEMKKKFVRFWIDRVYYNDPKVMVNFIKEDENLFYAKSRLPENFGTGVLVTLVYILVLFVISFFCFSKSFYKPRCKKPVDKGHETITMTRGKIFTILWRFKKNKGINDYLYNLLSGKVDKYNKEMRIEIDGQDLTGNTGKLDFLYIYHPDKLPGDITARDLATFVVRILKPGKKEKEEIYSLIGKDIKRKTLGELESKERGILYLSLLSYFKHDICFVDNAAEGMENEYLFKLNHTMKAWADAGAAVLLLTSEVIKTDETKKGDQKKDFVDYREWPLIVNNLEEIE